jgi:hypothetical protein
MELRVKSGFTEQSYREHRRRFLHQSDNHRRASGRTVRQLLNTAITISKNPGQPLVLAAHSYDYAKELFWKLKNVCDDLGIPFPRVVHLSNGKDIDQLQGIGTHIMHQDHFRN